MPSSVRAQRTGKNGQIMLGGRFPKRRPGIRCHRKVSNPLRRVLVNNRRLLAREDLFDTIKPGDDLAGTITLILINVNPGERPKGAVVNDVWVGDRQHHMSAGNACFGEHIFEIMHSWRPIRLMFIVHTVISHQTNNVPEIKQVSKQRIESREELVGKCAAGWAGMLHEVGSRDVHQVEQAGLPGDSKGNLQGVVAHIPFIGPRVAAPDKLHHIGDTKRWQRT